VIGPESLWLLWDVSLNNCSGIASAIAEGLHPGGPPGSRKGC
jgi:hypothetical protein